MNTFQRLLYVLSCDTLPLILLLVRLIVRKSQVLYIVILTILIISSSIALFLQFKVIKKGEKIAVTVNALARTKYDALGSFFWLLAAASTFFDVIPGIGDDKWKYIVISLYLIQFFVAIRNTEPMTNIVLTLTKWKLYTIDVGGTTYLFLSKQKKLADPKRIRFARKLFDGMLLDATEGK